MRPRTLAAVLLVVALVLLACGHCAGRRAADADARAVLAAAETRALNAAGALTAEKATSEMLARDAEALRDELADVRRTVPSAIVREVVRWRTAPMVAEGIPPTPPIPEAVPCATDAQGEPVPCLVPSGATLDVRVTEARVASESGAQALIGRAEVWRLDPPPETRVAEGPLRADLSSWRAAEVGVPAPPRRPRWAVSGDVGLSIDGPVYAAAVERRLIGPVWAGVTAGSVARAGYVAARIRVEW